MTPDEDDRLDLAAWTAPPPPTELADRVLTAVHGRSIAIDPAQAAPRRLHRGVVIAGALIAAAGLTFALWPSPPRDHRGQLTASAPSLIALADDVEALVETGGQLSWQSDRRGLRVEHVAGIVTYRHRGDHRLEVATPGGALTSERASFRVEAPMKRELMVGGGVAAAAALIVVAVYQGRVQAHEPDRAPTTIAAGQELALGSHAAPTATPRPVAVAKAAVDRARRVALAQEIAAARAAAAPRGGSAAAASPSPSGMDVIGLAAPPVDDTPGVLTKDEIRGAVKEIVPMLAECYEMRLEQGPLVGTTVKARFTIDSEPDLGAMVTVGGLEIDGPLGQSADFRDCLGATLEAMVLPPLGDGGQVEVNYPFVFRPVDDEPTPAVQAKEELPTPPVTPKPSVTRPPAPKAKPAPAPTASIPKPGDATASELLRMAREAAKSSQWRLALTLSEQCMVAPDARGAEVSGSIMVAVLAACNLKDVTTARKHYARAVVGQRPMLRQRCLSVAGFDLPE